MFVNSLSNLVIKKVISANRLFVPPKSATHRKNREWWAIALKLKGKTVYKVGDKSFFSDELHPVIIPKGCTYTWKCVEPGECIIIEFDAEDLHNTFTSFEIKDNNAVINGFSKIEKCLSAKKPYYATECNYYLYEILLFILKSSQKPYIHPKFSEILKPAMDYIAENYYNSGITNASLAKLCGISTVYFRKNFFNVFGTSPIKYLHYYRINKAKAILLSDYGSVEQVALSVGYNSIYHFSKMFKLYTGKSPTEFVKEQRKAANTTGAGS